MGWSVVVFLLVLWVIGLIEVRVMGAFTHLFLVFAIVIGIYLVVRRLRAR